MPRQPSLKLATVLTTLALVGLLGYAFVQPSGRPIAGNQSGAPLERPDITLGMGSIGGVSRRADDSSDSQTGSKMSRGPIELRVGLIRSTPARMEINSIDEIPILDSRVRQLYSLAVDQSCRILAAGSAVTSTFAASKPGQTGTIGRVPAITIGLKMAAKGRTDLPAVTRGQVDQYFAQHRLSIQPIVYFDEAGQFYLGTDCQAAFYETERPGVAVQPEPMIENAVARFRALGIVGSANESLVIGRTLMMAFTFEKTDETISGLGGIDKLATELLFFHLPERPVEADTDSAVVDSRDEIPLEVFITSDDRATLNRLDLSDRKLNAVTPTISAEVRFDKLILMGLYPSDPVVTKIHYRSDGVISMDLIRRFMSSESGNPAMSLDDILDQFATLPSSRANADWAGRERLPKRDIDQNDEPWVRETARKKYDRLDQSLKPSRLEDREMARPRVPLMTGLGDK